MQYLCLWTKNLLKKNPQMNGNLELAKVLVRHYWFLMIWKLKKKENVFVSGIFTAYLFHKSYFASKVDFSLYYKKYCFPICGLTVSLIAEYSNIKLLLLLLIGFLTSIRDHQKSVKPQTTIRQNLLPWWATWFK